MSEPSSGATLQEIARRLAEVFAEAARLVERADRENRVRQEQTARVAEVLAKADSGAGRRVMAARRQAAAAEMRAAHALADELRFQAGARALAAVNRYAGTLAVEAEAVNARRRQALASLGHSLGQVDQASAMALLHAAQQAEEQRTLTAQRHAEALTLQVKAVLGALPAPPKDPPGEEAAGRRGRRRAKHELRDKVRADAGPEVDSGDVVHLDPKRRRQAT